MVKAGIQFISGESIYGLESGSISFFTLESESIYPLGEPVMGPFISAAREIIRLVVSVCPSVWVCETYVVHHLVGTGLCCSAPTRMRGTYVRQMWGSPPPQKEERG